MNFKQKIYDFLKWAEKYTGTDMVYVAREGFWWIFGRVSASSISLLAMIAFAHWLPKETFGAYRYILSAAAILSIFTLPGMDTALIRTVARGYEKMLFLCAKTKFKWGLIGAGICFAISLWYFLHQNSVLGISFLITGVFLPLITTFNLFLPFWQGKKRFDIQSKYLILLNFLSALALIPVIFLTDNLVLIVLAYVAPRTFFEVILFQITLKKIKNQHHDLATVSSHSPEKKAFEERETISFGKHLTLMQTAPIFGSYLDKIIIWQFLGPTAVAIYSFAQIPILKIQELIPISPLALPKLSEKNIKGIKKGLLKKFLKLFLVSIPFTLFLILLAPYFYKILFPAYLESIPYFQILALTLILVPFSLLGTSLVAEMRKKELYIVSTMIPILQIILFLVLIPFYGIWGIIAAILIAQICGSALTFYLFKKI